jgi:hypothetical protein
MTSPAGDDGAYYALKMNSHGGLLLARPARGGTAWPGDGVMSKDRLWLKNVITWF